MLQGKIKEKNTCSNPASMSHTSLPHLGCTMSQSKNQQQHCKPKKQGNEPLSLLVKTNNMRQQHISGTLPLPYKLIVIISSYCQKMSQSKEQSTHRAKTPSMKIEI